MALFDDLVQGGAPAVRALLSRHETLELDFKQKGASEKDTKKVLGKALSAFANSMGGLIVWGADCRKDQDGVDQVIGFKPIEDLQKFASDIRDWTVEATMPRLADVRVEALDEGGNRGFLLVEVLRSERRPHQCEFGEKGYFRRAGASSRRMEHFETEDAFRRISVPDLQVGYRVADDGGQISGIVGGQQKAALNLVVFVSLRNKSRISARSAYVSTFQTRGFPHVNLCRTNGITVREQPPQRFFEIEPATIHPDVSRMVAAIAFSFDLTTVQRDVWAAQRSQLDNALVPLVVGFGCLDTPMHTFTINLSEAEIFDAMRPKPTTIVG